MLEVDLRGVKMKIKSIKKLHLDKPKQYYDVINANPYNNFLIKTNDGYIASHNCFFDEINKLVSVLSNKFEKIPVELLEHCFNFINYNAKMKYA